MQIKYGIDLSKYTTLRVGGIANKFYEPADIDELIILVSKLGASNYYLLGHGSNLLINDSQVFENVIYLRSLARTIEIDGNTVVASASISAKELIKALWQENLGGIEWLYQLPAYVGGMIYMNAGRGNPKFAIGNFVEWVDCFDGKNVRRISGEECNFAYRHSIFAEKGWIILQAQFKFPHVANEESKIVVAEITKEKHKILKVQMQGQYFPKTINI
jgi:UDP-N-acetylmuramate dehydrogenase